MFFIPQIMIIFLLINFPLPTLLAEWTAPIPIPSEAFATDPKAAIDANGNCMLICANSSDGKQFEAWAALFKNGLIESPHRFPKEIDSDAFFPNIAMNSKGHALAVWVQKSPVGTVVMSAYFKDNEWSLPQILSNPKQGMANSDSCPQIALDENDNGLVLWSQLEPTTSSIQSARFENGNWMDSQSIEVSTDFLNPPQLVACKLGGAIAIWTNNDTKELKITRLLKSNWTLPTVLTDSIKIEKGKKLHSASINDSGKASLAWIDSLGRVRVSLLANDSWTAPVIISKDQGAIATELDVVTDSKGATTVAWTEYDSDKIFSLFTRECSKENWNAPALVYTSLQPNFTFQFPKIEVDSFGNQIILWELGSLDSVSLFTSSKKKDVWQAPTPLFFSTSSLTPNLAMNEAGLAVSIWKSEKEPLGIYVSFGKYLFSPPPPASLTGQIFKNRFLTETEYVHRLTWEPSSHPSVIAYRLYKNGVFVADFPAKGPFTYDDRKHLKTEKVHYKLVSLDGSGSESHSSQKFYFPLKK